MLLNRISGAVCAAFGLLLYFVIIPYDTEVVDYGWVRPQTVPNAMAWLLVAAGGLLALRPTGDTDFQWRRAGRAGLFLLLVAVGVALIDRFGFLAVSPALALAVMALMGEKRLLWLVCGTVATPAFIWLAVSVLLQRPLP